MTDFMYQIKHH